MEKSILWENTNKVKLLWNHSNWHEGCIVTSIDNFSPPVTDNHANRVHWTESCCVFAFLFSSVFTFAVVGYWPDPQLRLLGLVTPSSVVAPLRSDRHEPALEATRHSRHLDSQGQGQPSLFIWELRRYNQGHLPYLCESWVWLTAQSESHGPGEQRECQRVTLSITSWTWDRKRTRSSRWPSGRCWTSCTTSKRGTGSPQPEKGETWMVEILSQKTRMFWFLLASVSVSVYCFFFCNF